MSRVGHPRFFGFVPSCGTWPGALGDLVASACNVYAGSWMESAGPSQVELERRSLRRASISPKPAVLRPQRGYYAGFSAV